MRALRWALLLTIVLTGYENCSNSPAPSTNATSIGANANISILQGTYAFDEIIYDSLLSQSGFPVTATSNWTPSVLRLSIDLTSQQLSVESHATGNTVTCALGVANEQTLQSILSSAAICQISPAPGAITCQAIASPDVQLSLSSNLNQAAVQLAPVTCGSGVQICGNNDQVFREALTNLQSNLPAGCAGIQ